MVVRIDAIVMVGCGLARVAALAPIFRYASGPQCMARSTRSRARSDPSDGHCERAPPAPQLTMMRCMCALVALACAVPARADLWVFADESGKTHFAKEQIDSRYQLFYKGKTNLDVPPPPIPIPPDFEGAGEIIRMRVTGHPNVARFAPLIERHAQANGLDPYLVKAVVAVESAFDPRAVSPKGAIGLMQVIPATGERYGLATDTRQTVEQKLLDPATNIRIGTRYLAYLMQRFDRDSTLALAGYNAGEQAVERFERRVPPFAETRAYVKLVQQFRDWFAPPPSPVTPSKPDRVVIPRPK